jgi:hypothetical protein
MATVERLRAIDFWRGALQIVILVDHMPGSFLNRLTPRNFGFSDAAEAFVFLSGVSARLAYLKLESRLGKAALAYVCARRALKIYGVHIALALGVFVLFAVIYRTSGVHAFANLGSNFGTPDQWFAFFALQNQPGYFNILPLYVGLMLWAPIAVVLAARDPRLAVAASFAIYLAARLHLAPGHLSQLNDGFIPFAWQLLFTIGVSCTAACRHGVPRPSVAVLALSVSVVLVAALVTTNVFGVAPGLRDAIFAHLDVDKTNLGCARLVHFLALAYLVAAASDRGDLVARFIEGVPGQTLQALGRNSLAVFAAGIVLSLVGRTVIEAAAMETSGAPLYGVRIVCVLTSITLLVVFGLWTDQNASRTEGGPLAPNPQPGVLDSAVTADSGGVIHRSAEFPPA